MAKITETSFAADAVKLWHLLGALNALKAKLRERGLPPCAVCTKGKRDKKLIVEYFKARNAAVRILNSLAVQIEH